MLRRLSFEESAEHFADMAASPTEAVDLNLPSVDVPTMPGTVTVKRTVTNVSDQTMLYATSATAPPGTTITGHAPVPRGRRPGRPPTSR